MKAIEAIDPELEKWFSENGATVPVAKTLMSEVRALACMLCLWESTIAAYLVKVMSVDTFGLF